MKAVLLILLGVLIALGTLMESMFTLAFIGVCVRDLEHGEHDIGTSVVGAIICAFTTMLCVLVGWMWIDIAWPIVRAGLGL
ncbi:hypothetical protein [Bifidobacterium apri]|uniref:Uncharacterized protein n=1 Tax=Bifidobacterium apri TaxID=1769423 RepID=A0A6A2V5W9_9BIFI|nr:hypothetical protein [Bifidobacterium apri]KAB8292071.1 hypothetical protein DSM100238_1815 [Bifidobacterium apri]